MRLDETDETDRAVFDRLISETISVVAPVDLCRDCWDKLGATTNVDHPPYQDSYWCDLCGCELSDDDD